MLNHNWDTAERTAGTLTVPGIANVKGESTDHKPREKRVKKDIGHNKKRKSGKQKAEIGDHRRDHWKKGEKLKN
jgi:hypothetical protein